MLVFFFFLFDIAEAGAVENGAFVLDGSGDEEHCIGQGRLAAPAVADEKNISDITRGVRSHVTLLWSKCKADIRVYLLPQRGKKNIVLRHIAKRNDVKYGALQI